MKNIGVILTSISTNRITGIERYAIEFLRHTPEEFRKRTIFFVHKKGAEIISGITSSINMVISPFNNRILTDQLWIPWAVRRSQVDYVYNTSLSYPLLAYGVPFVQMVFDATPWKYRETTSRGLRYYYLPLLMRALNSKKLFGILTISEDAAKEIAWHCPFIKMEIHPIYLGIDHHVFHPRHSDECRKTNAFNRYILAVGTLEPRKNLRLLLEAFSLVCKRHNDIKLVIVGRKGWLKDVDAPAEVLDRVIFTGYIPINELALLYSCACVFVFPSIYEGFGFPMLEAMAAGTAVVASSVSSLPEVGGDACLYADPHSVEDFSEKIDLLLSRDDLREFYEKQGIRHVEKFSWRKCADMTWSWLNGVFAEGNKDDF